MRKEQKDNTDDTRTHKKTVSTREKTRLAAKTARNKWKEQEKGKKGVGRERNNTDTRGGEESTSSSLEI